VEPADREPAVMEPAVIVPAGREPAVMEPAGREPAVIEPAGRVPAVREPAVMESRSFKETNGQATASGQSRANLILGWFTEHHARNNEKLLKKQCPKAATELETNRYLKQ
jgi:hypothetical protein